jgi:hypothetical protein
MDNRHNRVQINNDYIVKLTYVTDLVVPMITSQWTTTSTLLITDFRLPTSTYFNGLWVYGADGQQLQLIFYIEQLDP